MSNLSLYNADRKRERDNERKEKEERERCIRDKRGRRREFRGK
jgi:hypothetical protein